MLQCPDVRMVVDVVRWLVWLALVVVTLKEDEGLLG